MANIENASRDKSMLMEGIKVTKTILNSPAGSDMNYATAKIISQFFDELDDPSANLSLGLWDWVKYGTIVTVGDSMYGKGNPFRREGIASAFW